MESSPIVFIAALHGHAVAGGFELALSCDLVIAANGTLIGDGHVRNNLVPGGGSSVRITTKLGTGTAFWLALSGELATAESLAASGWLHAVVPAEELLLTAGDIARALSAAPAGAQRRFKTLLTPDPAVTSASLKHELDVFEEHWASDDVAASLNAFLTNA
jgi:enoyl-CoA hydratase/carnithine racemase